MAKKIEKDLEKAILDQSDKEKNKLLLRLISKDKILVEQLHFRLLEDPVFDLKIRKEETKAKIIAEYKSTGLHDNTKHLLASLRHAYMDVNFYKKITGDKSGEVELNIYTLFEFINRFERTFIENYLDYHSHKLFNYSAKKIEMALKLLRTLHEDYYIEYENDMNYILEISKKGHLASYVTHLPATFEY